MKPLETGKICARHPELKGQRYVGGNCVGCTKARNRSRYRADPVGYKALAQRWYRENTVRAIKSRAAWHKANPQCEVKRNLRRRNFTIEMFAEALRRQRDQCPVCQTNLTALPRKKLHADHDHVTGFPRGVLCSNCNMGLGWFSDSPERLINAAWYLMNPTLGAQQ